MRPFLRCMQTQPVSPIKRSDEGVRLFDEAHLRLFDSEFHTLRSLTQYLSLAQYAPVSAQRSYALV